MIIPDLYIENPTEFILEEELRVLHKAKAIARKVGEAKTEEKLRSLIRVSAAQLRNYSLILDQMVGRMPSPAAEDALVLVVSQMELLSEERDTLTARETEAIMNNILSEYRNLAILVRKLYLF